MGTLRRLVIANDLDGVRAYIASPDFDPAEVNAPDTYALPPLWHAVTIPAVEPAIVEALLEAGANPSFERIEQAPQSVYPTGQKKSLLIREAIHRGSVEIVALLRRFGADIHYVADHDYTAMLDAVHGEGDRVPMVQYLLEQGFSPDTQSSYKETPIKSAYRMHRLSVVRLLIEAGADESELRWTPLIRAAAIGSAEDVERELAARHDIDARDKSGTSAFDLCVLRGDIKLASRLLEEGALLNPKGRKIAAPLTFAIDSRNHEMIEWLVRQGADIEGGDQMGYTALACAAASGDVAMVRTLLDLGANPNGDVQFSSVIEQASNREVVLLLLEAGADPLELKHEGRRMLLDLGEPDEDLLDDVTKDEYLAGRRPSETEGNPEETTNPFRVAMIRSGVNAYRARARFGDEPDFACRLSGRPSSQVWCADRHGQSVTLLPDGRTILVAGEHEDYYDPDFCIYNDVIVFEPSGQIRIFGYPYSVFPPTDFHTATLVDSDLYILGSLGYVDERNTGMPVYRLNTVNYQMEKVWTSGEDPGRIYNHRAQLVGPKTIRIEGGKRIKFEKGQEKHEENKQAYLLHLDDLNWSAVEE